MNFYILLCILALFSNCIGEQTFTVDHIEKGICYSISFLDKIGISMICDDEYPKRVAIDFLLKIYDNFKSFIKEKNIDISVYSRG